MNEQQLKIKNTLKTVINYLLIGVIGFLPIALIFQIIESQMDVEEVSSFVMSVGVDFAKPDDVKTLN